MLESGQDSHDHKMNKISNTNSLAPAIIPRSQITTP